MFRLRSSLLLICAVGLGSSPALAQDKAFLLNIGKGQVPNDTAMDDKTVIKVVDSDELGGKALEIPLAAEDSFGMRTSAVPNWKKFERLRFNAFNPESETIELELVVFHSGSKSYETRIGAPIKLTQGKNEIAIELSGLKNNDGSDPDLSKVTKWYIGDVSKLEKTFFVGDIWLESGDAKSDAKPSDGESSPSTVPRTAKSSVLPLGNLSGMSFRVRGKIGDSDVDLTITPIVSPTTEDGDGSATALPPIKKPANKPRRTAADSVQVLKPKKAPAQFEITEPISFETPEADAIISKLDIFPPNNASKQNISDWPVHPNSAGILASIGTDKFLRLNLDMGYAIVPPTQEKVDVEVGVAGAAESDPGPFPIPDNLPIEHWPAYYQRENIAMTLDDLQRNTANNTDDDRHAIVIDPINGKLFEFWHMQRTENGWKSDQASTFDLTTNKLRPDTWTSADAAGLPLLPYVVLYHEMKQGKVQHAIRMTVEKSRKAYVYPATHHAGRTDDENDPRMGERLRLKKSFNLAGFTPQARMILKAMQDYGVIVADNGLDWSISIAADPRIPAMHSELRRVKGSDFEVIEAPADYTPPED